MLLLYFTITLSFILFLFFSALMLIKHVQYENKYYTILYIKIKKFQIVIWTNVASYYRSGCIKCLRWINYLAQLAASPRHIQKNVINSLAILVASPIPSIIPIWWRENRLLQCLLYWFIKQQPWSQSVLYTRLII